MQSPLSIAWLFRSFRWPILTTWSLVLIENTLLSLIPLFIGRAIDALLINQPDAFWEIAGVMGALILVASARRAFDTRCYGKMRVRFGTEVVSRLADKPVSQVNARLDMSREMVDFLERYAPELITAVLQVIISIVILWAFDQRLGLSALAVMAGLTVLYSLFHRRFFRLNSELNSQTERQVAVLQQHESASLLEHLGNLRKSEVRLSDTEVLLYFGMYGGMFAFVLSNLWLASTIQSVTAGVIFSILSYSWELVESGIALPITLQQWSRLSEIRGRLNEVSA